MNLKDKATIKIYTGQLLKNHKPLYFLEGIFTGERSNAKHLWNMFQGESGDAPLDFLRVVSDPALADFILLPYNYPFLIKTRNDAINKYISHLIAMAEAHKKQLLIFAMVDSDEHITLPHSLIFRYSQYRYKKLKNEIIIPPYMLHSRSDKLKDYRTKLWKKIIMREKSAMPTVSFCGWAGFPKIYRKFTYLLRLLLTDIKAFVSRDQYAELHKSGIYFRREAISAFSGSSKIKTNFIIRKAFSAQRGLDGKDFINPEKAEKESIESIVNSNFVLAPKGYGNASVRFFEALSLGRFPVLINTDCELPLKDYIDYDKFVVTVDHMNIKNTEKAIIDFYNSLTNEEYKRRQKMAREAFELLRPGSFLKIVLSELKYAKRSYKI